MNSNEFKQLLSERQEKILKEAQDRLDKALRCLTCRCPATQLCAYCEHGLDITVLKEETI